MPELLAAWGLPYRGSLIDSRSRGGPEARLDPMAPLRRVVEFILRTSHHPVDGFDVFDTVSSYSFETLGVSQTSRRGSIPGTFERSIAR
jgi:hypothetical protein